MGPWIELQLVPYACPALRNLEDYQVGLTVLEDYLEHNPYCLACLLVILCENIQNSGVPMRYKQHKQIHNITYNYVFKTISTCNVSLLPIITYYYCFYSF